MDNRTAKIVLLGDGAVGKTSLVRRFVEQKFDDKYITTIGVNVKKKTLEGLNLKFMIWDIYGQKLNTELHASNYSGAEGAIIVYDLTRKNTFENLDFWLEDLFSVTGEIPFVVLGNKFDILEEFRKDVGSVEDNYEEFRDYIDKNYEEVIDYYQSVYDEMPSFKPVPSSDLWSWADKKGSELDTDFSYFFSSAKTGENVEKAFNQLGKLILKGDEE
ncbi:MAG: Rab family GTPase [Thermoplasmatota archaeon]